MISNFLSRPGVQSSEFKVLVAVMAFLGVNASQHWLSIVNAVIVAAPGFAYAISRGLAKTETSGTTPGP